MNLSKLLFRGKNEIHVARAAEAGDIQFEYLPFKGKNKLRRAISKCYIFGILFFSFLFVYSLHSYKRSVEKEVPDLSACTSRTLGYILAPKNYTGGFVKFVGIKTRMSSVNLTSLPRYLHSARE